MNNPRAAYVGQMVNTASPSRLLVMLYDRLVHEHDPVGAALHRLHRALELVDRRECGEAGNAAVDRAPKLRD